MQLCEKYPAEIGLVFLERVEVSGKFRFSRFPTGKVLSNWHPDWTITELLLCREQVLAAQNASRESYEGFEVWTLQGSKGTNITNLITRIEVSSLEGAKLKPEARIHASPSL